jgi:hypothetical protein
MITFFNGRRRGLGEDPSPQVYAQVDTSFRDYLHLFKGAKLAIFLAIALHANEDGWSWPSYEALSRETGYSMDKIRDALAELCSLRINGHRILLRYQPQQPGGEFATNRYLLFPTPEEIEQFENAGISHPGDTGKGFNRGGKTPPRPPWWQNTTTDRGGKTPPQTITMLEPEPNQEEEEEEEGDDSEKIARILQRYGVFTATSQEIAALLIARGLSCEEAEHQFLDVLSASGGDIGRSVHRLRQGWDPTAPARARAAARRRRYAAVADDNEPEPEPDDIPPEPTPADPNDQIWHSVLDQLQLGMTRATFDTWLRDSRLVACNDGTFVVAVRNEYAKDWLENRLRGLIAQAITCVTGLPSPTVQFVIAD